MSTFSTSASANKMNSRPQQRIPSPLTITDSNGNIVKGKDATIPSLNLSELKHLFAMLYNIIRDAKHNYNDICAVFTYITKLLDKWQYDDVIAIINKMVKNSKIVLDEFFKTINSYTTIMNPIYAVLKSSETKPVEIISIEKMKEYENDIKELLLLVPQIVNTFNDTVYEIMYPGVISSLDL